MAMARPRRLCVIWASVLGRARMQAEAGADKKDRGPTGKQFFRQLEAEGKQVPDCCSIPPLHTSHLGHELVLEGLFRLGWG